MHHKLILLFVLIFPCIGKSQIALEKKIPAKSSFIMAFNLSALSQKIRFNDLGNYQFLKKSDAESSINANAMLKELFRLPEKAGISRKGKMYIFSEGHDSISNLTYLIALSDAKAFENRMKDILKTKTAHPQFIKIGKTKTVNYDHKLCITLAKDYAYISLWNQPYYSVYDYDEYNAERMSLIQKIDSITQANTQADSTIALIELPPADTAIAPVSIEEEAESVQEVTESYADSVVAVEPYNDIESNYDTNPLMKQFEQNWVLKRKQREDEFYIKHDCSMTKHHQMLNEQKLAESQSANALFAKIFAYPDDIIYWFNYDNYSQQIIDLVGDKYAYRYITDTALQRKLASAKPVNKLSALLSDNTLYGLGNFDKGKIKMTFYHAFNDIIKTYIQNIYSKDINAQFFKYVKKENLIGMFGISINTQATADLYYEILRRATESTAIPNKWLIAALELSDLFLDKNVIHHSFKGDALIAFTGIKSYLSNYISYEYDSLTFENRSIEKTKTKYIPEFTAVLTIDNLSNLTRILKLIKKMDGLTELSPNTYAFKSNKDEINGNFFVVIKDSLLFITNDKDLATKDIALGISPEKSVGNDYHSYLNNPSFGFLDASKMFKLMADVSEDKVLRPKEFEKWSEKINHGFMVCKPMVFNTTEIEITLDLKNRENSSLLELLKLFDETYLLNYYRN